MSRLPRGMVVKGGRYFARLFLAGAEKSFPLGSDLGGATQCFYAVRAALGKGTPPEQVKANLLAGRAPDEAESSATTDHTVAEALDRWLAEAVPTTRNAKGVGMAKARAERLKSFLGGKRLHDLSKSDMRRYRLHMEKTGMEPQTVKHYLSDARAFCNWAADAELVPSSPFPKRLLPRIAEQPPQGFSEEEAGKLAALPGEHGFVLRFLLGTGLRWGEATRALREHVVDGALVVAKTKSGKVRRVPLPPALLAEIEQRRGKLVRFSQPGTFALRVRKLTGIECFRVHRTRHHYACRWLERGGNLKALSLVLGHGSIAVTERYGRMSDEHVRDEAAKLWAAPGKKPGKPRKPAVARKSELVVVQGGRRGGREA